ncbi:hypothetical protein LLH06_00350 [Mucilaginibacter daejeonensis]|uniref:hypothetical protein n=1 Tax=Mucilaginibacter daejeonensis TaxID=398049 RepID=UPI001D17331B|nr:hypothetical protein [Mucilaginibacter daejeonensis]UEG53427.1 hypothetical protein LLH06_00350 [Mucilaginibacter daejeonensis]
MSAIFNQLIKSRIEQFNNCKPEGSGKWDVKPGQVIIQELHPTPIGITGETMFCDANWRPHANAPFFKGQTFRMNTDVLFNDASFSTKKDRSPQELIGSMVHISDPGVTYYLDRKGQPRSKYNVKWGIICKAPIDDTVIPKTAGIFAMVNTGPNKAKTLGEAMENSYAQSDESIEMASYYEGYPAGDEWDWHQPQEDDYYDENDTIIG